MSKDNPNMFDDPDVAEIPIHSYCRECGKIIRTTMSKNMFARHSYWDICDECKGKKE